MVLCLFISVPQADPLYSLCHLLNFLEFQIVSTFQALISTYLYKCHTPSSWEKMVMETYSLGAWVTTLGEHPGGSRHLLFLSKIKYNTTNFTSI